MNYSEQQKDQTNKDTKGIQNWLSHGPKKFTVLTTELSLPKIKVPFFKIILRSL